MKIFSGIKASKFIEEKLIKKISNLEIKPKIVIFQVNNLLASNKYISFKIKKAKILGIEADHIKIEDFDGYKVTEDMLINLIEKEINNYDGAIVQLPLPNGFDNKKILDSIPVEKDIDGLNSNQKIIFPATPRGIIDLLNFYEISWKNKEVSVVGQSKLVGKPVADFLEKDAKIVKRFTKETGINGTENSDILIVAVGKKNLIKKENIKKGAFIIDVGINSLDNKKITGDVDRLSVGNKPGGISPVPGGVGPMTIISLFSNTIDLFKEKNDR
ncbi:MAG: bifunctional 5,10-methylenetetrahydrofolate dehydrogenase/5,10-methenyltetrahydrofolate cyclohydrolase [Mollicutes bacterium PWAP]|nr:bifunctional 5,10-methylenetetrahydrofolate dehydrogenase/5,10-methenyltetrahydrofolate cyclohydrolase [Mollicutes bacterium PWAP]